MKATNAHWFILVLVNIPVFLALGKMVFKEWSGFLEALRLWSNADWWASLDKQWREDRWTTLQLPLFLGLCVLLVLVEHLMFGKSGAIKPSAQMVGML